MKQGIHEQSALPQYPIGLRVALDERVFRYCKADPTYGIEKAYYGAQDLNVYKADGSEDCWDGTVSGAHVAGSRTLFTLDTNTRHVADWFAGGWVWLYDTDWIPRWYRIKSSTAGGTNVTLTLYDPLVSAVADGMSLTVYRSIYSRVQRRLASGSYNAATVCVSPIRVTASYYFWGQTWGPCVGAPNIEVPGVNNNERNLVFNFDGSLRLQISPAAGEYSQLAGFNLLNPIDVQTDAWFPYMLQLAP